MLGRYALVTEAAGKRVAIWNTIQDCNTASTVDEHYAAVHAAASALRATGNKRDPLHIVYQPGDGEGNYATNTENPLKFYPADVEKLSVAKRKELIARLSGVSAAAQ
jgi:hypothetical protein